jgi:all-trans-8'-apo-beta-carotenal 15,15'-oxygenase
MATVMSRTLPWAGIFDAPAEVDATITDIEGRVPDGLVGSLYRNGAARLDVVDHLFDGDGMVAKVGFSPDGGIHFRNRYVRTHKYARETGATGPQVAGYGTLRTGGMLRNAFRLPTTKANAANTSVMFSAGRLLALWEAGHPWQVDPDTLETLGEMDFDGRLAARFPFSAHPHWDPNTREIYNFGMVYGPRSSVATYRIDRTGKLSEVARTPVPGPIMNHDFIVTSRWLVFFMNPLRFNLASVLLGREAVGDSLRFDHDGATRVLLVPRDGGEPVSIDAEPWFQFHFAAAFDDGDDVVVDYCRYQDYEGIGSAVKHFRTSDFADAYSPLVRTRISTSKGMVETQPLTEGSFEFPQVDGRRAVGGYRTVYAAEATRPGLVNAVARIDTETGEKDTWDAGPGNVVSEPLFVPRPGGEADDDGWLVGTMFEPDRGTSAVYVLDARTPGAGPLCLAHLPVNTGVSFHGTWRAA